MLLPSELPSFKEGDIWTRCKRSHVLKRPSRTTQIQWRSGFAAGAVQRVSLI